MPKNFKSILISLLILFINVTLVLADCSVVKDAGLGGKRSEVERTFIEVFGIPTTKTKDATNWIKDNGTTQVNCLFKNNKLIGVFTINFCDMTEQNAVILTQKILIMDKLVSEEGFVLKKEYSENKNNTESYIREYVCKKRESVKTSITVTKDFNLMVFSIDNFYFVE